MENNDSVIIDDTSSNQTIEFILLLIVEIVALICTIFLLTYIYFNWRIMITKSLHNHAIILIIIISFFYIIFDLPFTINSYRIGYDNPRTLSFCLWWYWIDYTLTAISLFLTATAGMQWYFLLFKTHLLRIRRTRWIIHYIPLIFCVIYPPVFYSVFIIFYPCDKDNPIDNDYCPSPCYLENFLLLNIDWMIHAVFPLIITILASGLLLTWMIHSMLRLNHPRLVVWKRQKRLIIQFTAFSSLYIIGWTPSTIVSVLEIFSMNTYNENEPMIIYLYYMSYFAFPLQPFICLFILPEPFHFIKDKMKHILSKSAVTPVISIRP